MRVLNGFVVAMVVLPICVLVAADSSRLTGPNLSFANAQTTKSLTLDDASSQLEQLTEQLLHVERNARAGLEQILAAQVKDLPKGEFESTTEYKVRLAKNEELRDRLAEENRKRTVERKDDLQRRVNQILMMEFTVSPTVSLGTYDADAERFPLQLGGRMQMTVMVPRAEAKELKADFSQAEIKGIVALQVDQHNHVRQYLLSARISLRGRNYQTNQDMNLARAMFMLYGNYLPSAKCSKWKHEMPEYRAEEGEYLALKAIPLYSNAFRENNTNKFILVTGSVVDDGSPDAEGEESFGDCHGCGVPIGMAVLSQNGDMWKVELGQKDVGSYGESGIPPKVSAIKIGADRYALIFAMPWTNMLGMGVLVAIMDRANGTFKEIFSLATSAQTVSRSGRTLMISDSRIEYIPSSHPIYFDIKAITSGKRESKVGGRVVLRPFTDVKVYKFSDDVYKVSEQH